MTKEIACTGILNCFEENIKNCMHMFQKSVETF